MFRQYVEFLHELYQYVYVGTNIAYILLIISYYFLSR